MRRSTLFSVLCALVVSGCFDDAVTLGLDCDNDLECGQGQACGPGVLEDNGSATPDQVCGVPQDEGWDPCQDGAPTICEDFETALTCRNGFRTPTDCDVVCEDQVGGDRREGVCGPLVSGVNADCACAYAIDETPDGAKECFQSEAGLELVRSTTFDSDDVAVYLQTCDEWCAAETGLDLYTGSLCDETFEGRLSGQFGVAVTAAITSRLDTCVCRLTAEPNCDGDPPPTRCVAANEGPAAVALCGGQNPALLLCPDGCGPLVVPGMTGIEWCR